MREIAFEESLGSCAINVSVWETMMRETKLNKYIDRTF